MNPPARVSNLLQLAGLALNEAELFEPLLQTDSAHQVLLERIVSSGQVSPVDTWYDQAWDEWVLVLQGEAELTFENDSPQRLQTGDSLLIPAHCRHRVTYTSAQPPCIWLALHLKEAQQAQI